jgi:uncharacterized protein (DUF1015 family)
MIKSEEKRPQGGYIGVDGKQYYNGEIKKHSLFLNFKSQFRLQHVL